MKNDPWDVRMLKKAIWFYPEQFRSEFAEQILLTYLEARETARFERRLLSFWLESLVDVISSIRRERRANKKKSGYIHRYSTDSRLLFHYARLEQHQLNLGEFVNSEHLLLGLLMQPNGVSQVLQECGCSLELLRQKIVEIRSQDGLVSTRKVPIIASETRELMALAAKIAQTNDRETVEPCHVLLAVLDQPKTVAYRVLTHFSTPEHLRSQIKA